MHYQRPADGSNFGRFCLGKSVFHKLIIQNYNTPYADEELDKQDSGENADDRAGEAPAARLQRAHLERADANDRPHDEIKRGDGHDDAALDDLRSPLLVAHLDLAGLPLRLPLGVLYARRRRARALGVEEVPKHQRAAADEESDQSDGAVEHAGRQQEVRRPDHLLRRWAAFALLEAIPDKSLGGSLHVLFLPLVDLVILLHRVGVAILVLVLLLDLAGDL